MNTCRTCQYWIKPLDGSYSAEQICNPVDPDTWEPMAVDFEIRECQSPKIIRFERPLESKTIVLVDGSCYMADLFTPEDFGCVNYIKGSKQSPTHVLTLTE